MEKAVVQVNGIWQILFKFAILTVPFLIALEVWQVNMIYDLRQNMALVTQRIERLEVLK